MIWLGLGTALLAWAAIGNRGKRHVDWITGLCAACLAAGTALSLRLYDDLAVALIVLGAGGAALGVRRLWLVPGQATRLASVLVGAAAIGFSLFGPAEGLF